MIDMTLLDKVNEIADKNKLNIDLPEIKGSFRELSTKLLADKEKISIMLAMLAVFTEGRYIRLFGRLAEDSIKYKKERKLYLMNLTLDILYFIGAIRYLEINDNKIIAEIIDDDILEAMSSIKAELSTSYTKYSDEIRTIALYYSNLDSYKEFCEKYNINIPTESLK